MIHSRTRLYGSLVAAGLLGAVSVFVQMERDRRYATDRPAEQVLYVQSPDVIKRMVLSYDVIAADVYWIRAIQHFGGERQSHAAGKHYGLLYPLLDLCTSLDPQFNLAYRFGATFLSEAPPGGPGRPDQAIALLKKGIAVMPEKWQYYQDAGFVEYWTNHNYAAAADWFAKGAEIKDAPWWLKSLAANTLAKGGNRQSSRMLYQLLLQSGENDFMKQDAARRLRQLDALDWLDELTAIVARYREAGGRPPFTWPALGSAGLLGRVPTDPDGFDFVIHPETGHVDIDQKSTLWPLPVEPPKAPKTTGPSA